MTKGIEFNEGAMRELFADIGRKIEDADVRFRERNEGKPLAEIQPAVQGWFSEIGIELQPGQIADYAAAVAKREPFEWVLQ
jgi:hypothetical protein